MGEPQDSLDLADYRRRVAAMYAAVRTAGGGESTWSRWCTDRDDLFRSHPQSPIPPETRPGFTGLPYFPYDPAWRFEATVGALDGTDVRLGHSGAGETGFRRIGRVRFSSAGEELELTVFWLTGYGGGLFVPFRDGTAGSETYAGGRYLLDTVKGADLGGTAGRLVLDFNFAYHPSCVHDPGWSCPLAPPENRLAVPVRAGERLAVS